MKGIVNFLSVSVLSIALLFSFSHTVNATRSCISCTIFDLFDKSFTPTATLDVVAFGGIQQEIINPGVYEIIESASFDQLSLALAPAMIKITSSDVVIDGKTLTISNGNGVGGVLAGSGFVGIEIGYSPAELLADPTLHQPSNIIIDNLRLQEFDIGIVVHKGVHDIVIHQSQVLNSALGIMFLGDNEERIRFAGVGNCRVSSEATSDSSILTTLKTLLEITYGYGVDTIMPFRKDSLNGNIQDVKTYYGIFARECDDLTVLNSRVQDLGFINFSNKSEGNGNRTETIAINFRDSDHINIVNSQVSEVFSELKSVGLQLERVNDIFLEDFDINLIEATGESIGIEVLSPDLIKSGSLGPAQLGASITAKAFNLDGHLMVISDSNNDVQVWDVTNTNPANWTLEKIFIDPTAVVNSVVVSPNGKYIAAGTADNKVMVWDISDPLPINWMLVNTFATSDVVNTVTWSFDNNHLVAGLADNDVLVWDVSNPLPPSWILVRTFTDATAPINSVSWRFDNQYLAAGTADNKVLIWDVSNPTPAVWSLDTTFTDPASAVNVVAWSPNGNRIAAGIADGKTFVWDTSSTITSEWQLVQTLEQHTASVDALSWSVGGAKLVTGGSDNDVFIFDTINWDVEFTFPDQGVPVIGVCYLGNSENIFIITASTATRWLSHETLSSEEFTFRRIRINRSDALPTTLVPDAKEFLAGILLKDVNRVLIEDTITELNHGGKEAYGILADNVESLEVLNSSFSRNRADRALNDVVTNTGIFSAGICLRECKNIVLDHVTADENFGVNTGRGIDFQHCKFVRMSDSNFINNCGLRPRRDEDLTIRAEQDTQAISGFGPVVSAAQTGGMGIYLDDCEQCVIDKCVCEFNDGHRATGIFLKNCELCELNDCTASYQVATGQFMHGSFKVDHEANPTNISVPSVHLDWLFDNDTITSVDLKSETDNYLEKMSILRQKQLEDKVLEDLDKPFWQSLFPSIVRIQGVLARYRLWGTAIGFHGHNVSRVTIRNMKCVGQTSNKDSAIGLLLSGKNTDNIVDRGEYSNNMAWRDSEKTPAPTGAAYVNQFDLTEMFDFWDTLTDTWTVAPDSLSVGFNTADGKFVAQGQKEFGDGTMGDNITINVNGADRQLICPAGPTACGVIFGDQSFSNRVVSSFMEDNIGHAGRAHGILVHFARVSIMQINVVIANCVNIYGFEVGMMDVNTFPSNAFFQNYMFKNCIENFFNANHHILFNVAKASVLNVPTSGLFSNQASPSGTLDNIEIKCEPSMFKTIDPENPSNECDGCAGTDVFVVDEC